MEVKTDKKQIKKGYSLVHKKEKTYAKVFWGSHKTGRRSGTGQITIAYCDELVKIWGGSPASEPLSYGSSTTSVADNVNADNFSEDPSSSSSYSLSNDSSCNYRYSSTSPLIKEKVRMYR